MKNHQGDDPVRRYSPAFKRGEWGRGTMKSTGKSQRDTARGIPRAVRRGKGRLHGEIRETLPVVYHG
jgi:hypothetical protein